MKERTYGRAQLKQGYGWLIDCEPQVAIRFKRTFPKVRQHEGNLSLNDTPENGRELAWFMERFPLVMSKRDRKILQDRAEQHRAFAHDIGRIVNGDYKARAFSMALPARPYQQLGAELAWHTGGVLIGDDVGLGKTVTAITAISDPSCRPALVVTLTALPAQWKAELERFLPGIRVHILKSGKPYPLVKGQAELFGDGGLPDVIISNYHKLSAWSFELAGKVNAVVFDECQELRRGDSNKYDAAKKVAEGAKVKMGLSATPIFNNGSEIFNITEVIRPGALGRENEFNIEWTENGGIVRDPRAFGAYLREIGLMLRRTRADVGRELPALTIAPHTIPLDFEQINRAVGSGAELARIILRQGGVPAEKFRAAEEFNWRLRQATGIAKAPFVSDFVRLLVESGESVLLAGWHHEVYALWRDALKDLNPAFFTGQESVPEKMREKDRFLNGETKVLIMSLRAGAGIDGLQKICRTVVIGEPDWSPAVHEQFIGRIYRDGQPDPVVAYFLLGDAGSDPVIADVLGIKKAQLEGIRDPMAEIIERSQQDPDRLKKLARAFLQQRGESVAETSETEAA